MKGRKQAQNKTKQNKTDNSSVSSSRQSHQADDWPCLSFARRALSEASDLFPAWFPACSLSLRWSGIRASLGQTYVTSSGGVDVIVRT